LFSFFRVLIEGTGQRYRLDFREERKLWAAIENMYVIEPEQRTLSTFAEIIGELKERLHRWTQHGQYGFLFDNADDTLTFSNFQTFNFVGWGDAPDVLEPLLFYVLHRASLQIADPERLATFKLFLLDEAWLFIKNETIRNHIVQAQKTWRKHNAAMILATQSIKELEESGMLQIVAESCPTKIFLANPGDESRGVSRGLPPQRHRTRHHLRSYPRADADPQGTDLEKGAAERRLRLLLDCDEQREGQPAQAHLLRSYGVAEGVRRLAEDHPFSSDLRAAKRQAASTTIAFPRKGAVA